MGEIKKYSLSYRCYVSISESSQNKNIGENTICRRHYGKKSYGGNQEWFPKEQEGIGKSLLHKYGCGVIAITDLFLYWAMTLPNGKETFAGQYIDERNQITKEDYMALVEEIRNRYAFIAGSAGTFAPQLTMAINSYAKDYQIEHKAVLNTSLSDLTMLKEIERMLQANQPIILMIGQSSPVLLSRLRKHGIPFYKQTRILNPLGRKKNSPYACYQVVKESVFGHFVTITGMVIDEDPEFAVQNIMLRISSWGKEYYISYHHLRQYINKVSKPYLSTIISINE